MVSDDRGQLLLIAALVVATTILGSVALLNAIHESPQITTEQDSKSLTEARQAAIEAQTNLERLFRYTTSAGVAGEPLPYANVSDLENAIDEYNEQLLNVSTLRTAGVVTVEYNNSASSKGEITTGRIKTATNSTVLSSVNDVPRMSLDLNLTNVSNSGLGFVVEFNESKASTAELNVAYGTSDVVVEFEDSAGTTWSCNVGEPETLQVDFRAENAVIQTNQTNQAAGRYCERRPVDLPSSGIDILLKDGTTGNATEGEFVVTGTDSSSSLVVNPAFEISYTSPEVSYEAQYRLYGGEG